MAETPILPAHDHNNRPHLLATKHLSETLPAELVEMVMSFADKHERIFSHVRLNSLRNRQPTPSEDGRITANIIKQTPVYFSAWETSAAIRQITGPEGEHRWEQREGPKFQFCFVVRSFAVFLDMEIKEPRKPDRRTAFTAQLDTKKEESKKLALSLVCNGKNAIELGNVGEWSGRKQRVWWFRDDNKAVQMFIYKIGLNCTHASLRIEGLKGRATLHKVELGFYEK